MPDHRLLALYGLKYNPFLPTIPVEDLWVRPGLDSFFFRVESLVIDGGFASLTGDPGQGKSKAMQLLAWRLGQIGEVVVGVMERPQSGLGDFYRELGRLFNVNLSPANRYGGFQALRARWHEHIRSSLFRPVLLVDEAQEVPTACLTEMRILGSACFDSQYLLTTVLCGDSRLPERFRTPDLLPLGSRVRVRATLDPLCKTDLRAWLDHLLLKAGAPHLLTDGLRDTLVDHGAGSPRVVAGMGADLLAIAAHKELTQLDEKLFIETFSRSPQPSRSSQHRKNGA
jgi:type II secretory pathway predicted ATPase ExeA